ncbi:mercuric transporter MerT family protein [Sphingomonas sp.]|uniref:mercuric transporter MerT family protein n=1 Tax=Sphingomonas sp. TaxID=28214 RepID=UPI00286A4DDE|nr:mercuric transporter MerT family protein [Sphingomonas sp.]
MPEFSQGDTSPPAPPPKTSSAALLTLGGLTAAFGVAACCALPLLMISLGVGTAWLGVVASFAEPNRDLLLVFAALALAGGAVFLWRQQRHAATCGPDGVCTRPAVRMLTLVGLLIGVVLLIAGYLYV